MSESSIGEGGEPSRFDSAKKTCLTVLGVFLCLFTLFEVNYSLMQPQSALAVFVGVGLILCFLTYPAAPRFANSTFWRWSDVLLAVLSGLVCLYVAVQNEPLFSRFWSDGYSLGDRAGSETTLDYVVGVLGVLLVLEATRRSIGVIVPVLAILFIAHSYYCYASLRYNLPVMPEAMLPHSGQSTKDIVSTSFLQSLGVFGPAATVMFKYVFLFVVFGAFLEMSGATQFIIDAATKTFGRVRGGPAMVSVMASGLMGSLSGSAVANAVTTGTFTIPMMRSARFPNYIAGGITAAAASGGALVPPVMGAGAYMMLELVQPQVNFLTIMKAAVIPAILYYFSILAVVYLYARRLGASGLDPESVSGKKLSLYDAAVFVSALGVLIGLLLLPSSPFRSVTGALAVILVFTVCRETRGVTPKTYWFAFAASVIAFIAHQLASFLFRDSLPASMDFFVAGPWRDAATGLPSLASILSSIFDSLIVAVIVLLTPNRRNLAFVCFFLAVLSHQLLSHNFRGEFPGWLEQFAAGPWHDPRTGEMTLRLKVSSILDSLIIGMFVLLLFALISPAWRPKTVLAFTKSAKNGIALVAASACVGIIIGIVQQTGIASNFSSIIKGVVETNLFLALLGIMVCSLVLGMGVPSVVCYLLMATLMGSVLGELGVLPLVAHLFIFYFGMMSMVTPPVALAGYASASIAEAPIMKTSFAAFRFSLVGFTLPFMFVYRPALCLLAPPGGELTNFAVVHAVLAATIGILALAAGLAGQMRRTLNPVMRGALFLSAALLLAPISQIGEVNVGIAVDFVGALIFFGVAAVDFLSGPGETPQVTAA